MKTSRKLQLIDKDMGDLLVKQIAHELKNFNLYNSFANFFSIEGIQDLEAYFKIRAQEELSHHQWIADYLSEADFSFTYPAVEINTESCTNWLTPFTHTVDREIQTTQMIYAIYELAMSSKDYMTASWLLENLIKEQIEEENISRMAKTIMEEDSDVYVRADRVFNLLNT